MESFFSLSINDIKQLKFDIYYTHNRNISRYTKIESSVIIERISKCIFNDKIYNSLLHYINLYCIIGKFTLNKVFNSYNIVGTFSYLFVTVNASNKYY